ncbi:MAG: rhomboid family intramembrane serine protease [Breznakibacter sp.]
MNYRPSFFPMITPVVKNILIINVLFFVAQLTVERFFPLTETLALHYPGAEGYKSFQLVTYMFLHDPSGFSHIFFNMFAVFMFGVTLEHHWGPKRFLAYYLITGIGAGLVQMAVAYFSIKNYSSHLTFEQIQTVFTEGVGILKQGMNYVDPSMAGLNMALNGTTIGASGAVFGILLAFGMLFPTQQIMLLFPPIPIQARYFVIIYGVMELFLGVSNFKGDNVAHFAHLGGMLFGFILIRYWRKKGIY